MPSGTDSKTFEDWAISYDADVIACDEAGDYPFAGYRAVHAKILSRALALRPRRVLDLGCGTGRLTKVLYDAGIEITGVDFSENMIAVAKSKMPSARFFLHDIRNGFPPEIEQERFDCVISTYSSHHLTDAEKLQLVRHILHKNLTENGMLLAGDIMFPTNDALNRCREATGDWDETEHYLVYESIRPWIPVDLEVGFQALSHCAAVMTLRPAALSLRPAVPADAAALADILASSWQSAYAGLLPPALLETYTNRARLEQKFARLLSSSATTPHIALRGSLPVGLVGYGKSREEDLPDAGEIVSLYVIERLWGLGVGKKLLDTALAALSAAGHKEVFLWVLTDNPRARRFYEKQGFTPDGAAKDSGLNGAPELRYRLQLEKIKTEGMQQDNPPSTDGEISQKVVSEPKPL
ncbi:MAG: GNAT family N-acetyltransferase [Clostridiales bacterium]|nr:GNAT family N-acetyltransferase [Clostridiales bacterium]